MTTGSPLLGLRNIETFYLDRLCVLRGLSLSLPPGEIRALIGPNGAGKTTLLKTILGLLRDQPRKGTVEFGGRRLNGLDPDRITALGLGWVPEHRGIFGELTVEENLVLGLWNRSDDRARADLERVHAMFPILHARRAQEADKLSGGEQQMLALGRAFLRRPKLLLLDEPSLGLSPRVSREVLSTLGRFREEGITVLLVEQNARLALEVADYGYVMEGGRIVLEGTAAELREHPDVQSVYLGVQTEESRKGWRLFKKRRRW
ncbi:MAG: ABC transporter ATP-binding protein [Nitrospirae bacterium]|nr:ABC transporter ATP-binding protein [Nitrospirota bacterium]